MNEVGRVHGELLGLSEIIAQSGDISAVVNFGEQSAKVLLLVGASNFERRIIACVEKLVQITISTEAVQHFVIHQAVERKFFSMFDFSGEAKNINSFFAKFGTDFASWAKLDLVTENVAPSIQLKFLSFCRLRNYLVHNNYATYAINKTLSEIWDDFIEAEKLVIWLEGCFPRFVASKKKTNGHEYIPTSNYSWAGGVTVQQIDTIPRIQSMSKRWNIDKP